MDASVRNAVERTLSQSPRGESLLKCEECGAEIPTSRREAHLWDCTGAPVALGVPVLE